MLGSVLDRISQQIKHLREGGIGPRWVVAVSGGADSVALLRALAVLAGEQELWLSVAHLNHCVRGEAANDDARFVEQLAESLSLPFDLGTWAPARSTHFETDARQARYDWLVQVARKHQAHAIAVAHTRDDQAETILHRIIRGTGLKGLMGMDLCRPLADGMSLVRPVLAIPRSELRAYLEELGQPFRFDATNELLEHTRNRIRLDLLPKLAHDYNPQIAEALVRLAETARQATEALSPQLLELERITTIATDEFQVTFDADRLSRLGTAVRVDLIRRAWRQLKLPERAMTAAAWSRIALFADQEEGRIDLPDGVKAVINQGVFRVGRVPQITSDPPWERIALPIPGAVVLPEGGGRIVASPDLKEVYDEVIDADCLAPPLHVDRPQPGDRFQPLGLKGGSTPLADFLRGRGLKKLARMQVPVIWDERGIIWVAGHRIAERVKLTDDTRSKLGLRWERG